jgi:uncharacterized RDD family membrane protein YckC
VSARSRPDRRRATRSASRKAPTTARPAAGSRGAGFLDYLIIALLVVLALIVVGGLLFVVRGGF